LGVAANVESRARWRPLTRWDAAGAFGDIGVLFPIAIALISLNHVNPTATLLAAGVTYLLAGRCFQIPIAVQPFKAVAAIALAMALPHSATAPEASPHITNLGRGIPSPATLSARSASFWRCLAAPPWTF